MQPGLTEYLSFILAADFQEGFLENIPSAFLQKNVAYVCLQCMCACLYNNVYLPRGGYHEVYMQSASLVTLALWEQMGEQWGVWNEYY